MPAEPEQQKEQQLLEILAAARDRYLAAVEADRYASQIRAQLDPNHPDGLHAISKSSRHLSRATTEYQAALERILDFWKQHSLWVKSPE